MQAMAVVGGLRYVIAQLVDRGEAFCAQQAFERGDVRLNAQFLLAGPHRQLTDLRLARAFIDGLQVILILLAKVQCAAMPHELRQGQAGQGRVVAGRAGQPAVRPDLFDAFEVVQGGFKQAARLTRAYGAGHKGLFLQVRTQRYFQAAGARPVVDDRLERLEVVLGLVHGHFQTQPAAQQRAAERGDVLETDKGVAQLGNAAVTSPDEHAQLLTMLWLRGRIPAVRRAIFIHVGRACALHDASGMRGMQGAGPFGQGLSDQVLVQGNRIVHGMSLV